MFNPIQIKHECIGVEDINSDGRINTSMFITENDYKYNQLPQFWGHAQLSTEIQPKTEIDGQHSLFQTEVRFIILAYIIFYSYTQFHIKI